MNSGQKPASIVKGWTDARYWSFIRSALRRAWSKFPNKFRVLNAAKRNVKKGRQKYEYQCCECKKWWAGKFVSVDHKIPAGSLRSLEDLAGFVGRLFCREEDLQVMCTKCHHIKTCEERGINPEVAAFRKLKASLQHKKLAYLELEAGTNAQQRVEIYTAYVENK